MFRWIQLRMIAPTALVILGLLAIATHVGSGSGLFPPLGAVAAFLALALWIIGIRSHDQAIRELRRAAEKVARNFEVPPLSAVERPDEIGALARAIRGASEALQRRAAAAQAEADELRGVLQSLAEGVIATDETLRVRLWSPRATQLLGLASDPKPDTPLVDAATHGDVVRAIRRTLETGETQRVATPLFGGSTGDIQVEVTATPTLGEGGAPTGAVVVLRDVTEATAQARAQREFAANVSHELRTPLSLIRGFVETLADGALSDPERGPRFLEIIARHVTGLERLVNDLLTLLTLEGRIEDRAQEPTAVRQVVESVLAGFEARLAQKEIELHRAVPEGLPLVLVRPDHLERVVRNLVENAARYTDAGGSITVSASASPRTVDVSVTDTGIGIPSEDLPHIFTRFFRVDRSRSRERGGTGLGLAIVKHAMQLEKGEVSVESRVGEGTTFTLRFRRADVGKRSV